MPHLSTPGFWRLGLLPVLLLALAGTARAQTTNFVHTGGPQTYTVPAGITTVLVTTTGGGGGGAYGTTNLSSGARVQATLTVTPGEVLTVMVGSYPNPSNTSVAGGYDGGGTGYYCGAGGGASDVRRASGNGSTGDYLASRNALLVAGGGGGSAVAPATGGTPTGSPGTPENAANAGGIGSGASQSGPGSGGTGGGAGGSNGSGRAASPGGYGCGGGDGYYGGGASAFDAGGGGSSSWATAPATGVSYGVTAAAGPGAMTITPLSLPDLVVSATTPIPAGLYNAITVRGGVGILTGTTTVIASVVVQSGGALATNCHVLTGPSSFTRAAGGALGICSPEGINASGSTGAVQVTGPRSFSPDASYAYSGTAAQVTGSGLPATVRTLSLNNGAGLTLSSPVTVGGSATLTSGVLTTSAALPLTLGATATLSETATGYLTGLVQTTCLLGTAGATESFGGLGLTQPPSGSRLPGATLVLRITDTARPGAGASQSVRRVFDIQPTTGTDLSMALTLTVRADELGGIQPANLRLFKRDDAGSSWQRQVAATCATAATSPPPTPPAWAAWPSSRSGPWATLPTRCPCS